MDETQSEPEQPPGVPRGVRRVVLLVVALTVLGVLAGLTGLTEDLSVARLQALVEAAGVWGRLLYVALFCGCYLATVPGMPFVLVAVAAYGPLEGGLLGYAAALAAVSANFHAGRRIGGQERLTSRWRFLQRLLDHLEDRPVRSIALARLVMMLTPPFDYGLGLTRVPYLRFLLGSALGLLAPVGAAVVFTDLFVAWLGG